MDTVRVVDYFYVTVGDRPGEGARVLQTLKDAGVNLMALHAFPEGRRAQVDFFPTDAAALKAAARKAGWKLVGPKKAFVIEGEDRVGALVDSFQKLSDAKINITATDAMAWGGRFGAIIWVKARDLNRAKKVLGAA
ncbi:MAG: hypothetical protein QN183_14385 [Armatimonadota bacterium]|nr:hypothetical protein [Armatimonadota bacterium]MDR7532950.1 hypothetical protein [Armatimonadota bacterium]MDR7537534.1 hypothetical protein [Armatimonadota bacterium]